MSSHILSILFSYEYKRKTSAAFLFKRRKTSSLREFFLRKMTLRECTDKTDHGRWSFVFIFFIMNSFFFVSKNIFVHIKNKLQNVYPPGSISIAQY